MLPTITQRLMMVAAIALGTAAWSLIYPAPLPADGWAGLWLWDARAGTLWAVVLLLRAGLPALGLALYVSSAGNPLSGIYTIGFSLLILAGWAGSAEGLFHRQEAWASGGGGGLFIRLEIELVLWALAWCFLMFLIRRYRGAIRGRLVPHRLYTPYSSASERLNEEDTPRFVLHVAPILAGLICAGLGWLGCVFLIRNPSAAQALGGIFLAFTVASLTARLTVATGNVVYLVLSPLLAGFIAYAHAAIVHADASGTDLIGLVHREQLIGPALALPIHWASAGMVGVATGIGMAQAIDRVRFGTVEDTPAGE